MTMSAPVLVLDMFMQAWTTGMIHRFSSSTSVLLLKIFSKNLSPRLEPSSVKKRLISSWKRMTRMNRPMSMNLSMMVPIRRMSISLYITAQATTNASTPMKMSRDPELFIVL